MGISANQARLMSLTARKSDLEYRAQQISALKLNIAQTSDSYASAYSTALTRYSAAKTLDETKFYIEMNGSFIEAKEGQAGAIKGETLKAQYGVNSYLSIEQNKYDTNTAQIASQEKAYDMELTQVNTEHDAIKTEYDSIKSLLGDNVEKSFNIFG